MKDYSYYIKNFTYEKGQEWYEDTKNHLLSNDKKLNNFELETIVLTCELITDEYLNLPSFKNEEFEVKNKITEQITDIIKMCALILVSKIS